MTTRAREVDLVRALEPHHVPTGSVLAIGVDVAWWGGSASDVTSQTETLACAIRRGGRWRDLAFQRLQLTPTPPSRLDRFTSNADHDASELARAITKLAEEHRDVEHVIVGLDAPLLARDRRGLPKRSRDPMKPGACADRECEVAFRASLRPSPKGWRGVNIQPGAPLFPRIEALVGALAKRGFRVYRGPTKRLPKRVLVECFPNDALWSAGVLGRGFDGFTFKDVRSYKELHTIARTWPVSALRALTEFYVRPVGEVARLPAQAIDELLDRMWRFFAKDAHLTRGAGEHGVVVGKAFDDAIDSALTLLCATSLADGFAHVHIGNDPADGHVVGPGLR